MKSSATRDLSYSRTSLKLNKLFKSVKRVIRYGKERKRYGDLRRRAQDWQERRVWLPGTCLVAEHLKNLKNCQNRSSNLKEICQAVHKLGRLLEKG